MPGSASAADSVKALDDVLRGKHGGDRSKTHNVSLAPVSNGPHGNSKTYAGKSMETVLGLVEREHAGHRVHPVATRAPVRGTVASGARGYRRSRRPVVAAGRLP